MMQIMHIVDTEVHIYHYFPFGQVSLLWFLPLHVLLLIKLLSSIQQCTVNIWKL